MSVTGNGWCHRTELPAEPASAGVARAFVRDRLDEHGLGHLTDDMRLVVSELVTNALSHAGTPFTVTLDGDGVSVWVSVRDGSTLAPVPVADPGLALDGRGLAIVDEVSHDWGVATGDGGGKAVWASFLP